MTALGCAYATTLGAMRTIPGAWRRAAEGAGLLAADGTSSPTIFAEMSDLAARTGAINLGQGFPDTDGPAEVLEAAREAISAGVNQSPPGRGLPDLRLAIAEHQHRFYGLDVDPETEVLVTAGATEALASVLLGLVVAAVMSLRHMADYAVVRRQHLPADTREGVIDWTPETARLRDRVAIFRLDGALFYGNARRFTDTVLAVEPVDVVIVRCHRMSVLDASGAEALKDVADELGRRGTAVLVQGMTAAQRRTASLMSVVSADAHVTELSDALAAAQQVIA